MRLRRGVLLFFICLGYGLISLYTVYIAPSGPEDLRIQEKTAEGLVQGAETRYVPENNRTYEIVIWDTCGLGVYLWKNILHGKITRYNLINGWTHDNLEIDGLRLHYNLGYGQSPEKALTVTSPNLVLIINGRSDRHAPLAQKWVDHVLKSAYIHQVAVMAIGRETCDDEWILPYLQQTRIKCLFMVYDSPLVDDDFVFQWPLGVASYRNFHSYGEEFLDLTAHRKYVFNFVGTVYEGTSRFEMMSAVKNLKTDAEYLLNTRNKSVTEETVKDMEVYHQSLLESDITLSPIGLNSECHRIYEALEVGSIPVVEDVLSEGTCGDYEDENLNQLNYTAPHRLLKRYGAPVIYIQDWKRDLAGIVNKFNRMSEREKFHHRIDLIRWYVDFKTIMQKKFLSIIRKKFFNHLN